MRGVKKHVRLSTNNSLGSDMATPFH